MKACTRAPAAGAQEFHGELARAAQSAARSILLVLQPGMPARAVAAALHAASSFRAGRLDELDCAAADAAGLEQRLRALEHGTLHLFDVARLDAEAQASLKRQLAAPDGALWRRVRICASAFSNLDVLADTGALRADLLYHLNGACVRWLPLRERRSDLQSLLEQLERGLDSSKLTRAARAALLAHPWPGHEREVELVLERAALLAHGGPIDVEHLHLGSAGASSPHEQLPLLDRSLEAVEAALIRRVLDEQGGNKSRAAAVLGLHRATLHQKLAAQARRPAR